MAILNSLDKVIATAKKLREVAEKVKDADTRNLIADLNLELADLKMGLAELQEEKLELEERLRSALRSDEYRSKLEMRKGLYYLAEKVPGKEEGPYCPGCFENQGKLMPMQILYGPARQLGGSYRCISCKAVA